MSTAKRVVLAAAIVMIDLVAVVIPLAALFLAYVIVFNPPWFRQFAYRLGAPDSRDGQIS